MNIDDGYAQAMADSEATARELLAQFQVQSNEPRKKAVPPPVETSPPVEVRPCLELAAVEVPTIANSEEFEFLPGHFDVHCVISEVLNNAEATSYQIKMRSGELQTVSLSHLQSLSNGQVALDEFHSEQDDLTELEDSGGRRLRRRPIPDYNIPSSSSPAFPGEEESGLSDSLSSNMRRSRRATRTRNPFTAFFYNVDSGDGRAGEESSSSEDIMAAEAPRKLRLRRGRQQSSRSTRHSTRISDTDSHYHESRGIRFSKRNKKSKRRNLREKYEDDISEFEGAAAELRYFGARETFNSMPPGDPFRRQHLNRCSVCGIYGDDPARGVLVFCQGCTTAYHQACLGPRSTREHLVTKVAESQFILQCRHCLGLANAKDSMCPHLGCCIECKDQTPMSTPLRARLTPRQEQQLRQENGGEDPITPVDMARVNNVDNLLFRCVACHRGYHFEHLPSLYDTSVPDTTTDDVAALRFREYSLRWECQDCISAQGEIGTMVAWRPIEPRYFGPGYTADVIEEVDKEYLIRWKGMSYYRTTWMPGSWVWGVGNASTRRAFFRSPKNLRPHMTAEEAIPEDFMRVDIVFDVRYSDNSIVLERSRDADDARVDEVVDAYVKYKGLPYEDAVWESPPDRNDTERWNDFKIAYEDWVSRDYIHTPAQKTLTRHLSNVRKMNFDPDLVRKSQPEIMTGGQIMDYQLDGMNWMYYIWYRRQNAILADEMGLGKTIQVIGLFATLIQHHKCWPFLVVVPNSTCPNWRKEIKQWVPSVRVVTYYGSSFARKLAQEHEMFSGDAHDLGCHVVVTSYETMIDNASRRLLSKVPWAGLIVDEGQRLKNDKSHLYEALLKMRFPFKVLLTGTPLQNNIRELFNVLQFCDPTLDAETLEAKYGVLSKENIPELHDMIRPFFLRRTKAQVLTFLPPVAQIIVPVSMSVVQKKLYKSILAKNPLLIKAIFQRSGDQGLKQTERHNLNNILMQLRKCLCHPFVYSKAIEEHTSNTTAYHRQLVEAAGKFQLLQLMLPKLQQRGHRVLIFSQFLDNLDLVEDFLDGLELQYRRLDGRMSSLEKQKQIDDFNADDSPYFAFLLSTRSGGIGINLASADTVIIMDPDFNPHQDMQALSRAHRIGQKNKVLVFQLMIRGSAEEKILQICKKKMVLDHVLIDRMIAEEDDGRDLESILRHGAQALFENDDSGDVLYDSEAVDKLLDRSQEEQARPLHENAGESQFSFARVWANDNQNMEGQLQDSEEDALPNSTVWEKILLEREEAAAEEARRKAETFGRGKRKRNAVDYSANVEDVSPRKPQRGRGNKDSDVEFREDEAMVVESSSDSDMEEAEDLELPKEKPCKIPAADSSGNATDEAARQFQRVDASKINLPNVDGNMERNPLCYICKQHHPIGLCPLKTVGVEYCGLCGIAHFGYSRTCPHLASEIQVIRMLDALRRSNESPSLIKQAKKYLQGIRRSMAQQQRRKEAAKAAIRAAALNNGVAGQPDFRTYQPTAAPGAHSPLSLPTTHSSSSIPARTQQPTSSAQQPPFPGRPPTYSSPYPPVSVPTPAPTTFSGSQVIDLTGGEPPAPRQGMQKSIRAPQPEPEYRNYQPFDSFNQSH